MYSLQSVSIFVLFLVNTIAMMGFVTIFLMPFGINLSSLYVSLIISLIGIALGFLFYGASKLKSSIKATITIGVMGSILLMIVITYFLFGLTSLIELFILLLKIGFFLMMCMVPIIGVFSILKKQRKVLLSSGAGILFFFFFVIILSKVNSAFTPPFYSENEIPMLLLFFLLFICYLELGATSVYFGSVIKKIAPNEDADKDMLLRFNSVFNRYLAQISIILLLSYFISLFILWYRTSLSSGEFMGVNLSSNEGIFILIIFVIIGSIVTWSLIPREKTELA